MKNIFFYVLICVVFFSFSPDLQKRTIRHNEFDIECYISLKKLTNFNEGKMYYWFKSGEIHQSISSSGGFVLHKNYLKYFKSNQLAEEGTFSYGLKDGEWRTWHENGELATIQKWVNGYKNGLYMAYDSLGVLTTKGDYKNNSKKGYWINYIKKDTVYYRNDDVFIEKPKSFVGRVFRKKDSLEKLQIKREKLLKKRQDSIEKIKLKKERYDKKRTDSIERAVLKIEKARQHRLDSISKSKSLKESFFKSLFKNKKGSD